jgi:nitrite reductase/ring-hydroxylating ferredoxin subunit
MAAMTTLDESERGRRAADVWVRGPRSAEVGRTVLVWRWTPAGQRGSPSQTALLWRTRKGRAVAMDARCPHRQYVMTDAQLVRDSVECPVHGFRFGADGRCLNVRGAASARLIDVHEADGEVWLAMGGAHDPATTCR